MKKGVKAIIFDVGGVLALNKVQPTTKGHSYQSGIHEIVSKKLKISLDQYFDAIDTAYAKSIEGELTEKQVVKIISKNLKITEKKLRSLYKYAYEKNFKQNKHLFKQANELKKLGYEIAILSDQWHLSKPFMMPEKYYTNFKVQVISCYDKLRKPNPKIYKLVLKKLKLKPSETIFVDNQKWNTDPAKKLGMQVIQYKDNKQLFKHKLWRSLFE